MLNDKNSVLKELGNKHQKEFEEYMKKDEQTDFTKMSMYLTKGNGRAN